MKNTARLLNLYACIYGLAIVVVASGLAVAGLLSSSGAWLLAPLALAPLGLMALAAARRLGEFRRYAHIPGPKPSFFLGNLRPLLLHEHGARDRALLELHRVYGPVVKVHLAWGSTPFVSLSVAPKDLGRQDMDSNRLADATVLSLSAMGLKRGERHTAHRQKMSPHFTPKSVLQAASQLDQVSSLYLRTWKCGTTRHGSLKADLHHWSANSLGSFLCGREWDQRTDLAAYLAAIGKLEEAISLRAFHPFFVRWLFPVETIRTKAAYRYLFAFLEAALERRLQRRAQAGAEDEGPRDVLETLAGLGQASGDEARWSHEETVEELISLVAGGTDAMSYTLAQALYLLSRNPGVQNEARARVLQAEDAGKNPFVLNILHETMRLFPAVPFSSKISQTRSMEVEGVTIPARTNVMWMKTAVGLNEAVFADARGFNPSRFAAGPGGRSAESITSAMPFGAGARHCIGRHMAEYLCTRLLSAVLREFELVPVHDVAVSYSATVSVTPSSVPVRLVPRPARTEHDWDAAACPHMNRENRRATGTDGPRAIMRPTASKEVAACPFT